MKYVIDARGLPCPEPVVLTKNKMKDFDEIEIIVDNETALENIKRITSSAGWIYENTDSDDNFKITIKSSNEKSSDTDSEIPALCITEGSIVVFSSDKMGKGDDDLGAILMKSFIHTLISIEPAPSKVIFYNSGVKLTADGSGVVDDLEALKEMGVEILICGTCVNYYNLSGKISTGIISNMFDILNTMNRASRLINP